MVPSVSRSPTCLADSWTSQVLPGDGDLSHPFNPSPPGRTPCSPIRSTARWAVRASPYSSRRSLSYQGSFDPGFFLEFQRSDPGGPRRRILSWSTTDFSARLGDLETWTEDPLVEGASRHYGPMAPSEASGWMDGSGLYPNGIDARGTDGELTLRGRWRSDRCDGSGREGAGVFHVGAGPIHLSLRSESGPEGSDHVVSTGVDWDRLRLRAASNQDGDPALWAGLDSSDGIWRWRGSARWISRGFRHGGIPDNWPGSSAADASLGARIAPATGGTLRIQALLDSAHGPVLRSSLLAHMPLLSHLQVRGQGLLNQGRITTWSSARLGVGASCGTLHPWVEQSWSDSSGSSGLATSLGFRWIPLGHAFRAEVLWARGAQPTLLVSHEGRIPESGWDLGFRVEGSGGLVSRDVLRGQAVLTCAW
jgi:hypothetical protein